MHSLVLRKGSAPRCEALGFQLAPGISLDEYTKQIESHGVKTERLSDSQPGIAETPVFHVGGKADKLHHIAFELRDWTHIRDACDLLAQDRIPLVWGPVRHGMGHNISIYHRTDEGQIIEHFCELDRVIDGLET